MHFLNRVAALLLVFFFFSLSNSWAIIYRALTLNDYKNIKGNGIAFFCKVKSVEDGQVVCDVSGVIRGGSKLKVGSPYTLNFLSSNPEKEYRTLRLGLMGAPRLVPGQSYLLYVDTNRFGKNVLIGGECYGVFRGSPLPSGEMVYANCEGNRNLFAPGEFQSDSKNPYILKMVQQYKSSGLSQNDLESLLRPQQ